LSSSIDFKCEHTLRAAEFIFSVIFQSWTKIFFEMTEKISVNLVIMSNKANYREYCYGEF